MELGLLLRYKGVASVVAALLALVEFAAGQVAIELPGGETPVTGTAQENLRPLDRMMLGFVKEHNVPGASLAVTKDGRLVYARGFGYADLARRLPVDPTSLFRIASVSKPITAAAVLQLVDKSLLGLDDPVVGLLQLQPFVQATGRIDPRLDGVTVRHLLQHTGGWESGQTGFDPMWRVGEIAEAMGLSSPCHPAQIVRYMFGRPLDFDPGARYAYSNFGYCVLGRVIEKKSGQPYEAYVKQQVLLPLDIRDMRIGSSWRPYPNEVTYYRRANRSC